jgi:hypothetical protein
MRHDRGHDIATPVTALTELAADEPDGSPAAELCWYLAREVRRRGHASTTRYITELRKNAADGGDGARLGAVPAPLLRPEPEEPTEMVRRAGWLSITERRDILAHRVAHFAQRRDGHAMAGGTVRAGTDNSSGRRDRQALRMLNGMSGDGSRPSGRQRTPTGLPAVFRSTSAALPRR